MILFTRYTLHREMPADVEPLAKSVTILGLLWAVFMCMPYLTHPKHKIVVRLAK